ncbi:MAG TPA: hypothetical protein VF601_07075 [Beijerinckiaceae bacterium]|jgi:hypothetical protein
MDKDRAARCYNLFRRKLEQDLYCAVPEDRPVPGFVAGEWEFRGRVGEADPVPGGFRAEAARAAERADGYYLFHAPLPQRASRSDEEPTLTGT